jgi:hypothetical protein
MSIEAVSWALNRQDLDPLDKFVLIALADQTQNEEHLAALSIKAISKATSLDDEAVRQSLDRLFEADLVEPTEFTLPGFDCEYVKLKIEEEER